MSIVAIKQLLEAGVHFGHQTRRWNPRMGRFVFQERNGIHIIDLQKTIKQIKIAYDFVVERVAAGGKVLFVGTKKQASDAVEREAQRCGAYYISQRWLGGLLTNYQTVSKSLTRLKYLEEQDLTHADESFTKKEKMMMEKEKQRLLKFFGGIKEMKELPDLLFVIDSKNEEIAVAEANRLKIPVVAIVDTNCDPTTIDYPVPGNDDAIRAIALFLKVIADAVLEGIDQRKDAPVEDGDDRYVGDMSDIEKEMLEQSSLEAEAENDAALGADDGEAEKKIALSSDDNK